jgi:hypothetical protein
VVASAKTCVGFRDGVADDHSSRSRIAPGLEQPTRGSQQVALASCLHTGWASPPLLFGLAPRGVFRAPDVAIRAVGSYPTFSPLPNAPRRNRQGCGFPQACRRGDSITGGLIFCGTFRSRRKIPKSCQWQLRRAPHNNPLALPGASPCSPTLLRAEDYGSPDFPPVNSACAECTGDHPTHPLTCIIPRKGVVLTAMINPIQQCCWQLAEARSGIERNRQATTGEW